MNKMGKILTVIFLIVAVIIVFVVKQSNKANSEAVIDEGPINSVVGPEVEERETAKVDASKGLPRLVDLGADKCIPCKMMAPILEELKSKYEGRLIVEFIDVWKNPDEAPKYGIKLIPTQIFFNASGKELFRHEGFYSKEDILAKWKELGVNLPINLPSFERLLPAQVDNRGKDNICYMCDGDIAPRTLVTVSTEKGPVRLCNPHCYFIMYSCLTEDKAGFEKKVSVTEWTTGELVAASEAMYLYGLDGQTGRPTIKAFADKITPDQATFGGIVINWQALQDKELSNRCGFCDRACYPQDAAKVIAGGIHTYGQDQNALGAFKPHAFRQIIGQLLRQDPQIAPHNFSVCQELLADLPGEVYRYREADSLAGRVYRRVYPNHLTPKVAERSAAVAVINGGIRLDKLLIYGRSAGDPEIASSHRAHHSDRQAALELVEWIAHSDDPIPHPHSLGIAQHQTRKARIRIDLDHGHICRRVLSYELGLELGSIVQCDDNLLRVSDDVIVRHNVSFFIEDEPRAVGWNLDLSFGRLRKQAPEEIAVRALIKIVAAVCHQPLRIDIHNRRQHFLCDGYKRALERFVPHSCHGNGGGGGRR